MNYKDWLTTVVVHVMRKSLSFLSTVWLNIRVHDGKWVGNESIVIITVLIFLKDGKDG